MDKKTIMVSFRIPEMLLRKLQSHAVRLSENPTEPLSVSRVIRDAIVSMDTSLLLACGNRQRKQCQTSYNRRRLA